MKIDVEGHEMSVLMGSEMTIADGRISNIIFENHEGSGSPIISLLRNAEYKIFKLGWSVSGPELLSIDAESNHSNFQANDYLATQDGDRTESIFEARGWRCLSPGRRETARRAA
jgi:hypothetical protein